jgi:hypothetical protein
MASKATFVARRSAVRRMLVQGGYAKAAEADDERLIKLLGLLAFKVEEEPDTLNDLSDGANKLFERFVTVLEAAGDDTDNIEFEFRDDDEEEADAEPAKKDEPAKKAPKYEDEDEGDKPAKKPQAKDEDEEDRPAKKPQAKDEDEDGEGQPKRGRGRPKLSEEEKAARAAAKSAKPSDNEDVAAGEPAEKQAPSGKSSGNAPQTAAVIPGCVSAGYRPVKFSPGRNQAYLAGIVLRAHLDDCATAGEITSDAAESLLCLLGDNSEEMGVNGAKRLLLVIAHALRSFTSKTAAKTEIDYLKSLGVSVPKEIASKLLGD